LSQLKRLDESLSSRDGDIGLDISSFYDIFKQYKFEQTTKEINLVTNPKLAEILSCLSKHFYIPRKVEVRFPLFNYNKITDDFIRNIQKSYATATDDKERVKRGLVISVYSRIVSQGFLDNGKMKKFDFKVVDNPSLSDLIDLIPFNEPIFGKEMKEKMLKLETDFDDLVSEHSLLINLDFSRTSILGNGFYSNESVSHEFRINVLDQGRDKSIEILSRLNSIFRNFNESISFSWEGMSYGEEVILNTLAVLYDNLYDNDSPSIIMIDEGDLGLHPEWQRRYIRILETFFKSMDIKSVQLILTSHSPFLTSDLPEDNIVFLKKNRDRHCEVQKPEDLSKTFGANIHSLFRNSFFLDNGLMGEFAKEKINKVIKELNEKNVKDFSDNKKKELRFIIQQIGEPLIQRKLQQMYDSAFHFDVQKQIETLEEELIPI